MALPRIEVADAAELGIGIKAVEAQVTRALRELRVALVPWLQQDGR